MESKYLKIVGAKQHNLKNINLNIPKNKLVVFTGVSGSGKSSLAFDTIYAEGQRRYVESLSAYARQFLGIMHKPDVDYIEGLSPAISIDQKTTSKNPRSTVGTVTEIYDYLRLLYARIGHPHCPICGIEISHQSLDQIVDKSLKQIIDITKQYRKGWFYLLSPVIKDKKGEFSGLFSNLKAQGYKKIRVDNYYKDVDEDFVLIKTNRHKIDVVIDKISLIEKNLKDKTFIDNLKSRLSDSIRQGLKLSDGFMILSRIKDKGFEIPDLPKIFDDYLFSEHFSCPKDNIQLAEIEPRSFSFNSPHGACSKCNGLGKIKKVETALILSREISITEGGILPFSTMFEHDTWYSRLVLKFCENSGIDPKKSIKFLTNNEVEILLYGTGNTIYEVRGTNRQGRETKIWQRYIGIVNELERKYKETDSDYVRSEIEKYMRDKICESCHGERLKQESLSITINALSISGLTKMPVNALLKWVNNLEEKHILSEKESEIAKLILKEVIGRLNFLIAVGLEYLSLNRDAASLSGGEAQRIRLASQIGSGLSGVLYVLDEPTIGLHQKDNKKLIKTLKRLRDLGNSVIVVEHDAEMMRSSDHIVDFGPGAGNDGGYIVAEGTLNSICRNKKSLTGKYLSGRKKIEINNVKADLIPINNNHQLELIGCNQFNLKNINVNFPLGKFVVITGVSGSGKSTLLVETLFPALSEKLNPFFKGEIGKVKLIKGIENVDKVILIDQSPIGRTPRSNPATYTKVFEHIRDVFALTKEAKYQGFNKSHFSFNLKGGRCENCEGQGNIKIEMQFMSDIWITCEVCKGKRYTNQVLEINYKGKNIAEVLDLSVKEALEYFHAHYKIIQKLDTLQQVGLGYIQLGQPATTLSGGEAQRVKLAAELSKRATGKTIYILDEPTTGLHFADIEKLLNVLKLLVIKGNSVFVIEHNFDVIKQADWIIDLGPDGGEKGGEVVAYGTPQTVKKEKGSYTARYL